MKKRIFQMFLWSAVSLFLAEAQNTLTLENIYKNSSYQAKGYTAVKWMPDNLSYTTLEADENSGARLLVRHDARTGEKAVLISAQQLIPDGTDKPISIYDYSWSANGQKLLLFTNTRRVWRYHTRGDYWVFDLASKRLQQIGKSLVPATLMFAKFSPDASRVAFVSQQNIYVEDLKTGKCAQLTEDGGGPIINGTFDWVYEEELSCRDGFRWSPDGQFIAYWQSDTRGTGTFYLINNIDSIYSSPIPLPYPKVGTTNSAVKIGLVPAGGGATRWLQIPGDPRNNYLARMDFIPRSNELIIQQLNRLQNTNRIWIADIRTLRINNIFTEEDEAFLDVHDNLQWLDQEQYFTWTSERDGWRHLYRVSRDGQDVQLLTSGGFDVIQVDAIDPAGGYVYYIASPDNFTQRYLYRSRLDGTGAAEKISPASQAGQHSYVISPDARWAIHSFQNTTTPPRIAFIELSTHRELRLLEDNATLQKKYNQLGLSPKEFIRVDIGDVVLDAWMIKPPDFDPSKKYPLIFYVYGEPVGSTVQDNWSGGALWEHYLAQQGYVVMSLDNRGTAAPRGRAWRKSIYRQIGILAAQDQARAAQAILELFPFIDRERIGIWGWSGGGQMTLNCLFRYPEIYKTGIAIAFVSDQKLYDTIYQERYMGLPNDNRTGYEQGSPIYHAAKLEGNLLIMHGTADDNVHYQSFEMLVDELIKHDKLFSMMSYPMRSHGISERANTTLHLRRTMEDFWKKNL